MEWQTIGYVLLGFALRFGIPLLVTAGLVVLLRKLDARWQAEAEAQSASAQASPAAANGRCWEITGCSEKVRQGCPAYGRDDKPCWQVFLDQYGRLKADCLECQVFRETPVAIPD
jgi:hypothetical protein